MHILHQRDGLHITLSKPFDTRAKKLSVAGSVLWLALLVPIATLDLSENKLGSIAAARVLLILFCAFPVFLAYRFLNSSFKGESMLVSRDRLTLIRRGLFRRRERVYETGQISGLRMLKPEQLAELGRRKSGAHPLGRHDRLAFHYRNKTVTSGENIYSWQFEALLPAVAPFLSRNEEQSVFDDVLRDLE